MVYDPPCIKVGPLDFVTGANPNCVVKPADKSEPEASSTPTDDWSAAPSDDATEPAEPQAAPETEEIDLYFERNAATIVRSEHRLDLIGANDPLRDMPPATFGFVFPGSFVSFGRANPAKVRVRRIAKAGDFEIHHRRSGRKYVLGYVRRDIARCLQERRKCPKTFQFAPSPIRKEFVLAVVPFGKIRSLALTDLEREGGFVQVLEVQVRS
ncbi:hypothetical protein [Novosphingobium taihuense]|uniref:HIRAN domain-containing protein n=1 Tax=Novosphingobium taihuense TaxID=260085 RepID=A0A7W7AD67_9SPHN|nr:hypothetical protein [Novosphingobium taihuense]MBB4614114.1 hypothetical protein [Novosphingobium taihuense]